jgi:hypothetical protein
LQPAAADGTRQEVTDHQIEVDDDVFDFLKTHAEPFVDTPNSVLRRVLKIDDGCSHAPMPRPGSRSNSGAAAVRQRPTVKRVDKPPPARAATGAILPEDHYELPLLTSLVELGGQAAFRDVLEKVRKKIAPDLTELDKGKLKSGGVRWENRLQFVRLRLIERGLLERGSPRGIWEITAEGRVAAETGATR